MSTLAQIQARTTDPETSHEAAALVGQSQAQRSVRAVVKILTGSGPLSDFQIRALWPSYWDGRWSFTLPSKARHWARQRGLVKHAGYGIHEGRRVRLWAIGKEDGNAPRSRLEMALERIAELEREVESLRRDNSYPAQCPDS